jgi:lipoic acid synthetase
VTSRPAARSRSTPTSRAGSPSRCAGWGCATATVTGVARDDQPDGAAGLYAETIRAIHELNPNTGVEILPPDFGAKPELVGQVFDARPEVFAHNLETVPRIFKRIRPAFTYETSLRVVDGARGWSGHQEQPHPRAWARRRRRSRRPSRPA